MLSNSVLTTINLIYHDQGLKKKVCDVVFTGQVNFPTRKEMFHSHLAQARSLPDNKEKKETKTCPCQAKFESSLSEGQAGIRFFTPT